MTSKVNNGGLWVLALVGIGVWASQSGEERPREAVAYDAVEMPADAEGELSVFGDTPLTGSEDVTNPSTLPMGTATDYGSVESNSSYEGYGYYTAPSIIEDEEEPVPRYFDEREAKRHAERKMARRGYDHSFGCTIDCSGHEAGWQYRAEERYPTYGSLDYGKSQSFAEGAQAYEGAVKKEVERARQDFEFGGDEFASSSPSF